LLARNLRLAELLADIGGRHGRTAGEVAIAWTLQNPAVTAAIVGMRTPKQVEGVVGAADLMLNAAELVEIRDASSAEVPAMRG
jgi:aryl-alcohol dehydrogenase-like predicted oxidoreductase